MVRKCLFHINIKGAVCMCAVCKMYAHMYVCLCVHVCFVFMCVVIEPGFLGDDPIQEQES